MLIHVAIKEENHNSSRRVVYSSQQLFGMRSTNQITIFSVSCHQNMLYNLFTTNISNLQLLLNYTARFGDLKQKKNDLKK